MEVLVVYQFCTFGGVERMLLNRAIAFKKAQLDIRMSIGYLHDSGALRDFEHFLSARSLKGRVEPFVIESAADNRLHREYDVTLVIDTPEVLPYLAGRRNLHVECHTPYRPNREYLGRILKDVSGIIVPSESFGRLIKSEFAHLPQLHVISNPIPDEFFAPLAPATTVYPRRPVSYLARLDSLKNSSEAFQVFRLLREADEVMFFIIGQGAGQPDTLKSLSAAGIMGKTLLRNSLPFDKVPSLVGIVKTNMGLFFSPSKGESFGLSVAEFMAGGVPVMVSDISAHRELVEDDARLLYQLGDIKAAARGLSFLLENWDDMSKLVSSYASKFREGRFIQQWLGLFGSVSL